MFHLIWYLLIGLIAGVIAKAIMHVHLTMLWTTIVGIIGALSGARSRICLCRRGMRASIRRA